MIGEPAPSPLVIQAEVALIVESRRSSTPPSAGAAAKASKCQVFGVGEDAVEVENQQSGAPLPSP
jgi:hypothetical protein